MKKIIIPIIALVSIALFSFTLKSNDCGISQVSKGEYEIAEKNCLTQSDISSISTVLSKKYGVKISETQDYDFDYTALKAAAGIKVVFKSRAVKRVIRARVLVVGESDGGDEGGDDGESVAKIKAIIAKYSGK